MWDCEPAPTSLIDMALNANNDDDDNDDDNYFDYCRDQPKAEEQKIDSDTKEDSI